MAKRTKPRQAMSKSAVDKLERKVMRLDDRLVQILLLAHRALVVVRREMLPAIRRAERR